MDVAAQNINNTTIRSILLAGKLTGSNFTNWHLNLRIVLMYEKKMKFVEQPIGPAPDLETADPNTIDKYYETTNLEQEVACLMLSSMSPDLQRTLEKYNSYDMIQELKTMFEDQAKQELFETVKAFHACKQEEGQSISSYLLKMKIYLDTLKRLGYAMPNELGVSLILNSLNKDYDRFIQNYNMHSMGKTIAELHAMLKLHEKGILKKTETPAVLAIREAELKKRKNAGMASTLGIFTIELYAFPNKTWVYDTGCGTHICNTLQGLRRSKKLKHRALSLKHRRMRTAVEAIGSFDLILPSGLIIVLDNCHFAPTVTRGVVLSFRLVENGYSHTFTNYGISVSKDNVFYFNTIPHDAIYEIDMHNLYPNVSSTFNVSNKRIKYSLDSSYLWHCRLGHINKKRMDKLQRDGILQSTHDESLEKCKSCIIGKMMHKPFPHQMERAKDVLGLIHIDVCGPFRTVSREGASYFVTFTDDFSRYGYVYLMKHKHEVFKTFKVFQNEFENQLGKKIKVIRSDRGGEYFSHEFVNHMKSCGIGYALESVTRILNMVPTKKVKRTPYEIWHVKAPKLSYLRVWGCEALVKRDAHDKLDPRSIKCIFVDYPKETIGYYFYYPPENKIFFTQNAEFFENSLIVQEASGSHGPLKMSKSDKELELIQEEDTQPSENTSEEHNEVMPIEAEPEHVKVPIHRNTRIPQAPDRYGLYVDVEEYELGDLNEPPNYKVALSDPEYDKWLEAMNTEMQSMKDNQVWVLVDLPSNGRIVGSKWLFKKKTDMDGNVHTFKAHLVAKGYTQTYNVDFRETFSPVVDIRAIRILLAIVAFYDYEIWQMDVKIAFLNGHLSENVYMVQPKGFVDLKHPNKVFKLQRSIYGLKQASRSWNKRLRRSNIHPWNQDHDRSKRLIALSQSAYLEKILNKFRMENFNKPPIMEKPDYRKFQGAKTPSEVQRMHRVPYALDIGSIMNTKDMVLVNGAKPEAGLKVSCYADKSAKQSTTAMSSIEAEYIAAAEASMEAAG
ncbi:retrotransposon protein, putative, ty1-copia subclass [Tanacetum coccineum]